MNPVAVLQLLQSLQGLSQLPQLTSNLGGAAGLGPPLGGLSGGGGMPSVGGPLLLLLVDLECWGIILGLVEAVEVGLDHHPRLTMGPLADKFL